MTAVGHFGCPKFTLNHISGYFRSIQILKKNYKMAAGGHFGCPKITFDLISGHFRSIHNSNFFDFFYKMAAVGHFGCQKFTALTGPTLSDFHKKQHLCAVYGLEPNALTVPNSTHFDQVDCPSASSEPNALTVPGQVHPP